MLVLRATEHLPRLLVGFFFVVMSTVGVLTMLRPLLHGTLDSPYRDWAPALVGMQAAQDQPALTLEAILDRRFQRAAESWVASNLPQRAVLVRSFNEVIWLMFGESYMAKRELVLGRDGMLFSKEYIAAYCWGGPIDPAASLSFAARVRHVQDWFAARGQFFVYMLVPTKPSFVQHSLPTAFPCEEKKRDQLYSQAVTTLRAAGVNLVDGRAALLDARVPMLFPRNGTHWNWQGAAIATDALVQELRRQGLPGLADFKYSVSVTPDEFGNDRDLAYLLNLWHPPPRAPSVAVRVEPTGAAARNNLTLVAVNDSFFEFNAHLLSASQIFGTIDAYGYLTVNQGRVINGVPQKLALGTDAILKRILSANVVVLEVVEIQGLFSDFITQTLKLIEEEARRGAPSSQ